MILLSYLLKLKNIFKKVSDTKLEFSAKNLSKLADLKKPLVIFNVETTGWSLTADKIIEIAYVKIWKDGRVKKDNILLNPEIKISKESEEIHGVKNMDLKNNPTFKKKSQELWDIFYNCGYGGFNILDFDLPILKREFLRAGMDFNYATANILDSKTIYAHMEPRTLSGAYKYYCRKEHVLHASKVTTNIGAVTEVLKEQYKKYGMLKDWDFVFRIHNAQGNKHEDVSRKFYWRNGKAHFNFSKYKEK